MSTSQAQLGITATDIASPAFWQFVVDSLPVAVLIFNEQFELVAANQSALAGLHAEGNVLDRLGLEKSGTARETVARGLESLFGNVEQIDLPAITLNTNTGQRRLCNLSARRLELSIAPAPQPPCAVLLLQEITEVAALKERLAVSEKMAAVGELAAKVAHELNNPLDGIMRYIALSQRKLREKSYDDLERYMESVQFGLNRMAEIVRELLEFGRHTSNVNHDSDIQYIMEQSVRTMQPLADRNGVQIVCNYSPTLSIRTSPNLYQVLCNLIKNAVDAMPNGGSVTIIASQDEQVVTIRVQDSGQGIRAEDMPFIFEPFFSTKPNGQGTGLGLAVSKEIIVKLGGSIFAANRERDGCEVTVRLPLMMRGRMG